MFLPIIKLAKSDPNSAGRARARKLDIDELMVQVAPAIENLLADGVPRSQREISTALESAFEPGGVRRALMRLAVTGRLVQIGRKYTLPPEQGTEQEAAAG